MKNQMRSSFFGVLATYAVACFVALQVLDIILEPLGLPVTTIRWVMLVMLGIAPLLIIVVVWRKHQAKSDAKNSVVSSDENAVFHIGSAELDTAQRQILFSQTPVDVQPKVFDLIEYLVRARDRVVSKDELFDSIWPDVVVSEASLTQSIKRARDIFRQNGFDSNVIRTVSRKGYQFDHPVESIVSEPSSSNLWKDIAMPVAAVSLVASVLGLLVWNSESKVAHAFVTSDASNSLVVLPFANMTPDVSFSYFSDGITETVTDSLTRVRELRVIAHGSAFSFRESPKEYATIGKELNVAHVVEGSVQRNNNDLRIAARLIRVTDGEQLWSQIYSRSVDDTFAIQDEIARSIAAQMARLLSLKLILPDTPTAQADDAASAEAYRLLLLGMNELKSASVDKLKIAEGHFRAAIKLNSHYAEAILALADVLRVRATYGELPREQTFTEALTLINQALELQPNLAGAYLALGEIQHRHLWDFDAAAASYTKAIELNPGSADTHSAYSRFLSKAGRFVQSTDEGEVALDLDPKSTRAASSLVIRQIRARQLPKARKLIDALRASHPNHADIPWLETHWHMRSGAYRDALQSIALEELDYLRLSLSAIILFHLDRTDQAIAALDELIATDAEGATFQIAEVYAQWGEIDLAFTWLDRAFSKGDPGLAELYSSVNLEPLYIDSRFAPLAERIGLPPLATH